MYTIIYTSNIIMVFPEHKFSRSHFDFHSYTMSVCPSHEENWNAVTPYLLGLLFSNLA